MTSIRKALIPEFGDSSVIQIVTDTIPPPAKGEVQLEPIYSGFGGSDINMRLGTYPMMKKAPLTPGYAFIGRVKVNGEGATKFAPGTIVAAMTVYDSEAQLINQPEKYLVPVPAGVNLQQATPLILDWSTAYAMVHGSAKVSKGQRVFVHGISGSVGGAIARLSALQGATVYGTASTRNHDAVRAQGYTPFDYKTKDWQEQMRALGGAHAVFDSLGFESFDESFSILSSEGSILVGYGQNKASLNNEPPRNAMLPIAKLLIRGRAPFCKKSTAFYYITRDDATFQPNLLALFDLLKTGQISVPIKQVFDLENVKDAHDAWANAGSGIGSFVIKISDE